MVRTIKRRGQRVLVIDFSYTKPDGNKGRYRRDAEVQTRAAALAEERRRLAAVASKGSPFVLLDEAAAKAEAEQASPPAAAGPTFGDVVKGFFDVFAPSKLKASTRCHYKSVLYTHVLKHLGNKPLVDINAATMRELDATLAKSGAGKAARRGSQVAVRSVVCRYAVEAGLLAEEPRMPKLPKKSEKITKVLSTDDATALIAATRRPEHRLALLLAFHAGLRTGEIRGLRVCDVDLVAGVLRVRQAIGYGVVDTPKSGHDREVPLTAALREALTAAVDGKAPEARVALSRRGTPWGDGSLYCMFVSVAKRAGIKGATTHHLRHAFVTALLNRGVGAHVVQALAGHADLSTTQRYAHALSTNKRAAIDTLDGIGGGKSAA